MAKISLSLVFALVLSVALHSVLCEDNPWQSLIDQAKGEASKAGFSDDTIFGAQKAVADGSAEKAAREAFGGGSLNDWVQQAGGLVNGDSSSSDAAQTFHDYDEDDSSYGDLEFAPKRSPSEGPSQAPSVEPSEGPSQAPSVEPSEEPSEAPQAQSPSAE